MQATDLIGTRVAPGLREQLNGNDVKEGKLFRCSQ
jgi:hypothetical protein